MGLWLARKVQLMARARVDVGEVFRDGPRVEIVGADGRQAMDTLREEGDKVGRGRGERLRGGAGRGPVRKQREVKDAGDGQRDARRGRRVANNEEHHEERCKVHDDKSDRLEKTPVDHVKITCEN